LISRGHEESGVVSSRRQTAATSIGMRVIRCIGSARNDESGSCWQAVAVSKYSNMDWNCSLCCLHHTGKQNNMDWNCSLCCLHHTGKQNKSITSVAAIFLTVLKPALWHYT